MLIQIGDVTTKFGISHRSLHYWESAGILASTRGENDYRYYDEENMRKIKQIMLLRKLRLSIPSIREIFRSNELAKIISVFTEHLDESKKGKEQLSALGIVLTQLINMLKDKQNIENVYNYLDTKHSTESEELKTALKTVLSEPIMEIVEESQPEPVVDMTDVDLSLERMTKEDIGTVTVAIKRCYAGTKEIDKLFFYFNFENQLNMPDCALYYKIIQNGECAGAVNLVYVGMEAMLIRCIAYGDPDNNIYLFELLKQKYPGILCWNIYFPNVAENKEDFCYDWEGKKRQFAEDNGFTFYTDARWNRFIKMLKPHDEVYNSSRYRFALLDGSMDGVSFRFFELDRLDYYDGKMPNWRITDCDFAEALIYNSWMGKSRFYESALNGSDFRYTTFDDSTFYSSSFRNCQLTNCDIGGMTINGINVEEAINTFKKRSC